MTLVRPLVCGTDTGQSSARWKASSKLADQPVKNITNFDRALRSGYDVGHGSTMPMLKAILLDLGKVIVPFDFSIGYRAIESRCGLAPDEIRERIRRTGLVPEFETGAIESRDFVQRLCQALGVEITYGDFCEIWSSIFARETLIPEAFLEYLKGRYKLILVSNTNAIHFEMIRETYPLLRHFDASILSFQVKAMKPSPAIFAAAVKAAGCEPGECFFTDDIEEYVQAACAFGIDAVQFESFPQLEREMSARGVEWMSKDF